MMIMSGAGSVVATPTGLAAGASLNGSFHVSTDPAADSSAAASLTDLRLHARSAAVAWSMDPGFRRDDAEPPRRAAIGAESLPRIIGRPRSNRDVKRWPVGAEEPGDADD
jgi:hypothetical protein